MELDRDDLWRKAKAYTDMLCAYGKASGRINCVALLSDWSATRQDLQQEAEVVRSGYNWAALSVSCSCMQPVVHFGFIPAIILLGMTITEPKPGVAQLLSPI